MVTPAVSRGERHVDVTQAELANFVFGKGVPDKGGEPLAKLDRALDRSRLVPSTIMKPAVLDDQDDRDYNHGLKHQARSNGGATIPFKSVSSFPPPGSGTSPLHRSVLTMRLVLSR